MCMSEENNIENGEKKETYQSIIQEYFQKYKDFFPNEQAKAVFLEGVLAGFLLEVQRMNKPDSEGNEPFWRSLHNLNLDARTVKNLFPKIVDKLKMYKKSYSGLVSAISEYIQQAGNIESLDRIEISWFFSHGLSSYQYIRKSKK